MWTKTESKYAIIYTHSNLNNIKILLTRIAGEWTRPSVYMHDKFHSGYRTVKEAKAAAENLAETNRETH